MDSMNLVVFSFYSRYLTILLELPVKTQNLELIGRGMK